MCLMDYGLLYTLNSLQLYQSSTADVKLDGLGHKCINWLWIDFILYMKDLYLNHLLDHLNEFLVDRAKGLSLGQSRRDVRYAREQDCACACAGVGRGAVAPHVNANTP